MFICLLQLQINNIFKNQFFTRVSNAIFIPLINCREELKSLKVRFGSQINNSMPLISSLCEPSFSFLFLIISQGIGERRASYILEFREKSPEHFKTVSSSSPNFQQYNPYPNIIINIMKTNYPIPLTIT